MAFDKMANKKYYTRYVTFACLIVGLVLYMFVGAISTEWINNADYSHIEIADYVFIAVTAIIALLANYEIVKLSGGLLWPWWAQGITYILMLIMFLMPIGPNVEMMRFPFYQMYESSTGHINTLPVAFFKEWIIAVVFIVVALIYFFMVLFIKDYKFKTAAITLCISLFIAIALKSMVIFMLSEATTWTTFVWLLLIIICTDTFAFVGGISFGKHKLAPTISPNKTIEGSAFGTIVAVIAGVLYSILMYNFADPSHFVFFVPMQNNTYLYVIYVLLSILLSLISQIGDLAFSWIKRRYGIKDFSNLLPGHGGVLDRLDSISFVFFIMFIISSFSVFN